MATNTSANMQPAPFEIATLGAASVASNGAATVTCYPHEGARLFRRRAVKSSSTPPPAEAVLPQLNALAGELLARLDMPATELSERLHTLVAGIAPPTPQHIEWAVAELDGVRMYFDGAHAILTRQDLMP